MAQKQTTNKKGMMLCEYSGCNKIARYNIQQQYHLYRIDKDGNYSDIKDWEGGDNDHYCEEHAKMEGII